MENKPQNMDEQTRRRQQEEVDAIMRYAQQNIPRRSAEAVRSAPAAPAPESLPETAVSEPEVPSAQENVTVPAYERRRAARQAVKPEAPKAPPQEPVAAPAYVQPGPVDPKPEDEEPTVGLGADSRLQQTHQVINRLQERLNDSRNVFFQRQMRMIDYDLFNDLLSQLRVALPDALREADQVLSASQQIIDKAQQTAWNITQRAEETARTAQQQARQLRQEAEAEAQSIRERADQEAQYITQDAQTRANLILEAADKKAQALVAENEIYRRAESAAMEMQDRAQENARAIYAQAMNESTKLLTGAAVSLSRSAQDLNDLREKLTHGSIQQDG